MVLPSLCYNAVAILCTFLQVGGTIYKKTFKFNGMSRATETYGVYQPLWNWGVGGVSNSKTFLLRTA